MLIVSIAFAVLGTHWIRQSLKKIEISLKKSEQKYKVLFESLPIGISVTDPEGNMIEGNPASEAILTVPNQELTERTYDSPEWQIIRFDGSPMPASEYASVRALTENREIDNVKMGLLDANGNVRWLSVSAAPTPLKEYGVAIAYVDITDFKQTEEALRQSEAVLNSFLENAPTPICIKDLEGTYLSINKEFAYWMQMPKEEIIGKKDQDFFPDEVIKRLRNMEKQAIFEEITVSFEQTVQLPDGVQTFIMNKFPIIDDQNKVQTLAGIYLDISDRKRAELELAYNHDLREEIYNGSADAIFLVDPFTLLIFDCNRCAVKMFEADSKQELIGIEGQTLQKHKFTEAEIISINDDIEQFGYWSQETEYITKKGKHFWGNLAAKTITVAEKEMNLVRVTDISDRKRADLDLAQTEAELRRVNRELQKLVNLDGLTQIANRRCFDERIEQECQRLHREQQPLSLLMFDVDYFKRYNDCYGHQLGDDCLVKIAQAVDRLVGRAADLVARYGGEEFIVILPNTNIEGAIAVSERIHAAIADLKIPHECSDVNDFVSVSMGIVSNIPNHERSPSVLISHADQALYHAKQQGRNQSVVFTN
jgi:diguanylate cyclase (GGDEF)-like protein/PAS domain S-box-containing protein